MKRTILALALAAAVPLAGHAFAAGAQAPTAGGGSVPQRELARTPDVIYVPTPEAVVRRMLDLARVKKGDVVYDLGCGDGRIVVEAARRGARKAVGVDVDPERVKEARDNVKRAGVGDRARIVQGDLFETDLSDADVVTLYLLPSLNLKLRPTLLALRPGTRVVSHAFDMGDWKPEKVEVVEGKTVFFWTVPARGAQQGTASGGEVR